MQRPTLFSNNGQLISAMLHLPLDRGRKLPAVLLCHGFTGQKVETHRLFVTMSRELEKRGIASLRFDFRGSGESEGSFAEMTVSGEISDAQVSFEKLRSHRAVDRRRVGVLGLSLGGCVAACLAGREKRIASLCLWSAVANPAELLVEGMSTREKRILKQKGRLDWAGMPVGREFFEELPSVDPLQEIAQSSCPVFIVHGTDDQVVPPEHAERFYAAARKRRATVRKHLVRNADHVFSSIRWTEQVVVKTAAWFARTLR